MSDCVAPFTLTLHLKKKSLAASNRYDSYTAPDPPAHCKESKSLSAAALVKRRTPPSALVSASVADPAPVSAVVMTQSPAVYLSKSSV
jgi:hypothetical protein